MNEKSTPRFWYPDEIRALQVRWFGLGVFLANLAATVIMMWIVPLIPCGGG